MITQSELILGLEESEELIKQKLLPTIALAKDYQVEKNDVLHDYLSNLAEQMISLNKEKQSSSEKFFEWMANNNIKSRSEMKPSTYLNEFWNLELKEFNSYLAKNKVVLPKITRDYLEEEFLSSKKNLLLLSSKIKNMDWLIDQVVYALYGLTDEEIAVVDAK